MTNLELLYTVTTQNHAPKTLDSIKRSPAQRLVDIQYFASEKIHSKYLYTDTEHSDYHAIDRKPDKFSFRHKVDHPLAGQTSDNK